MYEQNTCKNTWKKTGKRKQNFQKFCQIITACHIELWVQEMTMNEKLTMIGLKVSQTGTISASESFCSQFCWWQFLLELCNWHIIEIMQVPMSVAIMQFLRFYCNYVGGTFCYIYVGRSFCCNYAGDCFCFQLCSWKLLQHLWWWKLLQQMCGWQFLLTLCTWESLLQSCQ